MSNGLLTASGYGDYRVTVLTISHGVRVISGAPDQARDHRAFYLSKRTSGTFTLGLVFTTFKDYARFGTWIQGYGKIASTPNTPVGAMRAVVPARGFDRVGVPVTGITFGDTVGQITYPVTLRFDGAREEEDFKSPIVSSFVGASFNTEESRFFYPAADQLSGIGSAEDVLYGQPQGTAVIVNIFKNLFGGGAAAPPVDNMGGNQR